MESVASVGRMMAMMEWADGGEAVEIVWIHGKIDWDEAVRENTALPVCVCVCVCVCASVQVFVWI
jgi:uncharacterized membrane protein